MSSRPEKVPPRPIARPLAEQWDAGYPRVSTDMQVERDALQNQIQALEAYGASHGLSLRLYPDAGVSAKDTDRPKLQELLADVRAGRVRSVVVTKLDRISRSLSDLLDLMRLFEEHGVKFISVRDNIDTTGPVGRFTLHILGAIAELERGITAERVAEDMKLRARRGKWNGGMAPYGRELVDGQLRSVPAEADLLRRMRQLLLEKRSWRGTAVSLNREGKRTRGWESAEKEGRVVRKGKPPAPWTPVSVKRVLLQRINEGTLVYNRHQVKGRTHVPRPAAEHVVVEGYCEPIFTSDEMKELVRIAASIEGVPPRRTGSEHVLSGLVYCRCGSRMYAVKNYVTTKRGRRPVVYYRCRKASQTGTCGQRQVAASVIEPLIVRYLQRLRLDPERLTGLIDESRQLLVTETDPLRERRRALVSEIERLASRRQALLELAEDRLIDKTEFARRNGRLAVEQDDANEDLKSVEAKLNAQSGTPIDLEGSFAGLRQLSDVFSELEDVAERRRLLETCLSRLVVGDDAFEFIVHGGHTLLDSTNGSCSNQEE